MFNLLKLWAGAAVATASLENNNPLNPTTLSGSQTRTTTRTETFTGASLLHTDVEHAGGKGSMALMAVTQPDNSATQYNTPTQSATVDDSKERAEAIGVQHIVQYAIHNFGSQEPDIKAAAHAYLARYEPLMRFMGVNIEPLIAFAQSTENNLYDRSIAASYINKLNSDILPQRLTDCLDTLRSPDQGGPTMTHSPTQVVASTFYCQTETQNGGMPALERVPT